MQANNLTTLEVEMKKTNQLIFTVALAAASVSSYAQTELTPEESVEKELVQECERQGKGYELKADDLVDFIAGCVDELQAEDEELEKLQEDSMDQEMDVYLGTEADE